MRLTLEGCWERQRRLNSIMIDNDIEAALLTDVRHVHYFTGYWNWYIVPRMLLVLTEGPTVIVTGSQIKESIAVDEQIIFQAAYNCTMIELPVVEALHSIYSRLKKLKSIGIDSNLYHPFLIDTLKIIDITPFLLSIRRSKDPDEVETICRSIFACDSGYNIAREILTPGIREIEIYAQMQAAAVVASGEPLGEFIYDFQSMNRDSIAPMRAIQNKESCILDVSVEYRGYRCDQCRTFIVGTGPAKAQEDAHKLVLQAIEFAENKIAVGVSCKQLWNEVSQMINVRGKWQLNQHLGHGIGLFVHESPRLNPSWNDYFEEGDVFAIEIGLYSEDLCPGVSIPQAEFHGLARG